MVTYLAAYLALKDSWVTRDTVVDLFWPDVAVQRGRHNLAQLLYQARRSPWGDSIDVEPRRLRLEVETDVARFRRAAAGGEWSRATAQYTGELLEGVSGPLSPALSSWLEGEREDLRETWSEAVRHSAESSADSGDWSESARLLRRLLGSNALLEGAVQSLIRAEAMAGRRDVALQVYDDFTRRLDDELGLRPLAATSDLAEWVRSGAEPAHGGEQNAGRAVASRPPHDAREPGRVLGLPPGTDGFIGRATELAEIARLLRRDDSRLVTVVGPGGIGKTSLAARLVLDEAGRYGMGVAWVGCANATSDDDVVASLARVLTMRDGAEFEAVANALAGRDLVLVLDQLEHLPTVAGLVVALLDAAPRVTIVATSRAALDVPGEHVYRLGGLSVPPHSADDEAASHDAVELVVRVARRVDPDFQADGEDRDAIVELTRLLEGNPLGLELAAGWLRVLEPVELLAEVRRDLDVLRGNPDDVEGAPGADPARTSLRAVFESSWLLLTADEREAVRKLAVFRGGCTRDSALAVADVPINNLLSLTNRSLLKREAGGRFAPHPVVRHFAGVKLAQTPDVIAAVEERHGRYFLALAQDADRRLDSAEQSAALERLDAEAPNIVAALERAIAASQVETAGLLVAAMGQPWRWRGRARYGLDWCARVERLTATPTVTAASVKLLQTKGLLLEIVGEYDAAHDAFSMALEQAESLGDFESQAAARMGLSAVAWRQGDLERAAELLEGVCAESRGRPERERALRGALGNLGNVARDAGRLDTALQCFDEALVLAERAGNVWQMANMTNNRAIVHAYGNDLDAARVEFEKALALQRSIDNRVGMSMSLTNLGVVHMDTGDLDKARDYFDESLTLCEETANLDGVAHARVNLGAIHIARGEFEAAHHSFVQGLQIRREIGARGLVAPSLACFVGAAVAQGHHERALVAGGAVGSVAASSGVPLSPRQQQQVDEDLAAARATMDAEQADALLRRGASMDEAEAVAYVVSMV